MKHLALLVLLFLSSLMICSAASSIVLAAAPPSGVYLFTPKDLDGTAHSLSEYRDKVLLIVNTASECGYTPQYAGLEKLYEEYRARGLVVLGFPSNDFGGQEPGSDAKIKFFCKSNYAVQFPMFGKGIVSGKQPQALFSWLLDHSRNHEDIGWNFEKFLVSRHGEVLARFKSDVTPESPKLISSIEAALAETGGR